MADLQLRRNAIHALIDGNTDRLEAFDALQKKLEYLDFSNKTTQVALVGAITWTTQALMCLLQIELDRLDSLRQTEDDK